MVSVEHKGLSMHEDGSHGLIVQVFFEVQYQLQRTEVVHRRSTIVKGPVWDEEVFVDVVPLLVHFAKMLFGWLGRRLLYCPSATIVVVEEIDDPMNRIRA